jgi:hypothetical protein
MSGASKYGVTNLTDDSIQRKVYNDLNRRAQAQEKWDGHWITVGDTSDPQAPSYENGWTNAGIAGMPDGRFYLDGHGRVHVEGAWTGGAIGTTIFTLPVDYRPGKSQRYACAGADGVAVIQIDPTGEVTQIL